MRTAEGSRLLPISALLATALLGAPALAEDMAFAYQGYLDHDGQPVNDTYDFWVYLYNDASNASSVPPTGHIWSQEQDAIPVRQGHFAFVIGPVPSAKLASRPVWVRVVVKKDSDPDGDPQYWSYLKGAQQLTATLDASNGVPPGSVQAFAGTTVPEGWLPCDGSPRRSTDYPRLFAAIGTRWGNGSVGTCSTAVCDFNLPDMRGRFLRGDDASTGRDPGPRYRYATGGATSGVGSAENEDTLSHDHGVGSYATGSNGSHSHTYKGYYYVQTGSSYSVKARGTIGTDPEDYGGEAAGAHGHSMSGRSGGTGGNETRPENVAVLYIVKY